MALIGDLAGLARTTSLLMLAVFALVNLALWKIKRGRRSPVSFRPLPIWVPIAGFFVSSGMVLNELVQRLF